MEKQMNFKTQSHYIRMAGTIALIGNLILAVAKLVFGKLTCSMAVLGDGIDSSTDVLIAILTIVISKIISRPSDREHPWGHSRAETTATMVLTFIIFYAGLQLCVTSVQKLIHKEFATDISWIAIGASAMSIGGKIILSISQHMIGKKSGSEIVKANAANMKNDIILSSGVLAGLLLSHFLKKPILDPIIAIAVGLWVIKNAITLFFQMNMELMDGNKDSTLYRKLFDAVLSVPGAKNPHRARIRKMSSEYDIDLDIEVDPTLSVYDAHELSEQVEEAIRLSIPECYAVMIHIEPEGSQNHQRQEEFGLRPEHLEDR